MAPLEVGAKPGVDKNNATGLKLRYLLHADLWKKRRNLLILNRRYGSVTG